jgi:hypothetical protein
MLTPADALLLRIIIASALRNTGRRSVILFNFGILINPY